MKNKFTALVVVLNLQFCCFIPSYAQEIIYEKEIELSSYPSDKISIENIRLNKDGSYALYAFFQTKDSTLGSATGYLPVLLKFRLNNQLEVQQKVREKYYPETSFVALSNASLAGSSTGRRAGKSFREMVKTYPDFFQSWKRAESVSYAPGLLLNKPVLIRTNTTYEYDEWSHSYTEIVKQQNIPLEIPVYENATAFIHDEMLVDHQAGMVSMILSAQQYGDNAYQLLYLNQTIVNCNLEGKQLSRYHLAFDYPSEVRLHQVIKDQNGNSSGVAYIFGPARRFGFKMTDPDPHNYRIVVMNSRGERVFDHKYRYGVGGGASVPFYVASHNNILYVLGKGLGRYPDYHLFTFDASGLKKATLIDPDMLFAKTSGDYGLGIRKDYASTFQPAGFVVGEDGAMLFYGEHRSTVKNAKTDPATGRKLSAVYEYPSYTFLQFDKEGNFLKNYVVEKGADCDELIPAKTKLLFSGNGKVYFWATEALLGEPELMEYQKFYSAFPKNSQSGDIVLKNYTGKTETSSFITVDLQAGQIEKLDIAVGFQNLEGQKYYIFDPVRKELLLLGKADQQDSSVSLLLKKIRF